MENRARYLIVGSFLLIVIFGLFAFIYWLNRTGSLRHRESYRVTFSETVSGLQIGASVLFDGIRSGEVTDLAIDPTNPRNVQATLAVDSGLPVRADTHVTIDYQGLMGTPVVILQGGAADAPPVPRDSHGLAELKVDPLAGRSLTQMARDTLQQINGVISDNSSGLKDVVANVKTFTDALARNSGRVDGILDGLERMTSGKPAPAPPVFDLATPKLPPAPPQTGPLSIAEPAAVIALQTQRMLARGSDERLMQVGDAQWSDTIPKMVQAKLMQALDDAGLTTAMATGVPGDTRVLNLELRRFDLSVTDESAPAKAVFSLSAKLAGSDGKIVATRLFTSEVDCGSREPAAIAKAFSTVLQNVTRDLEEWIVSQH